MLGTVVYGCDEVNIHVPSIFHSRWVFYVSDQSCYAVISKKKYTKNVTLWDSDR